MYIQDDLIQLAFRCRRILDVLFDGIPAAVVVAGHLMDPRDPVNPVFQLLLVVRVPSLVQDVASIGSIERD
jgi:hypothetical protein